MFFEFAIRRRVCWSLLLGVGLLAGMAAPRLGHTASGATFEAQVIGVADGDSLRVLHGRESIRIRLEGIDCPEMRPPQPYCRKARTFTSQKAFNRKVQVRVITTDKYGRRVCRVVVDGQDLSVELLRAGLAWHYKHFNQEPALASLQAEAQARKRGLWADPNPIPPWDWRRLPRP
jgi:micrococcal nuclease